MSDGNELLYDFKKRSDESGLDMTGIPSLTVQSDAVDADINTIVRRFGITGKMPENFRLPEYGDYDDVNDFMSAQLALANGQSQFMTLPGEIRALFEHDAGKFYEYAVNPDNYDGLASLGLAKPREDVPTVTTAPVAPPPGPPVLPPSSTAGSNPA